MKRYHFVPPGGGRNFGWNPCEGFHVRGNTSTLCTLVGRTDPILVYRNPSVGVSVLAGYRYRGPYPQLNGVLFFADIVGALFAELQNGGGSWDTPVPSRSCCTPQWRRTFVTATRERHATSSSARSRSPRPASSSQRFPTASAR